MAPEKMLQNREKTLLIVNFDLHRQFCHMKCGEHFNVLNGLKKNVS